PPFLRKDNDMHRLAFILSLLLSAALSAVGQGTYTFTKIQAPGSQSNTFAYGINDSGAIVGQYYPLGSGPSHAFLLKGGQLSDLDFAGAISTGAYGISASGAIVGSYMLSATDTAHGFLYQSGQFTTIDVPGERNILAAGINLAGQIVGTYQDSTGATHGFF